MKVGVVLQLTDRTPPVVDLTVAAEQRGIESLWLGEHTHLPVATRFHYSEGEHSVGTTAKDGFVPDFYRRMVDPYVTLSAAAAATSTIRLGTCIALPTEHALLALAKQIATLDTISAGRFDFGVGYGWNRLEAQNNGVEFSRRRSVLRETIDAMKRLWTQETASYGGEFVRFEESWSYPQPFQRPHPPILLGAAGSDRNLDDVVSLADGWMPVRHFVRDTLRCDLDRLRAKEAAAGASPRTITVVDPEGGMAGKRSRADFVDRLPRQDEWDEYAELGVERVILGVPVSDRSLYEWALDRIAAHVS